MNYTIKYITVTLVLIIFILLIMAYVSCINTSGNEDTLDISIASEEDYRACFVEYNNGKSVPDYSDEQYIKINCSEKNDGLIYSYGVILPYSLWKKKDYQQIVNHAGYFVNDYACLWNKYDLQVSIGTINVEPEGIWRVGIGITGKRLNIITRKEKDIEIKKLSFRFSDKMIQYP